MCLLQGLDHKESSGDKSESGVEYVEQIFYSRDFQDLINVLDYFGHFQN